MRRIDLDKELLYNLYIVKNLSAVEIAKSLGYTKTTIRNNLHRYSILKSKDVLKKLYERKRTEHPELENQRTLKQKETRKLKYGDSNYNNSKKRKKTMIKKYGFEYASQNKNVADKIKETKAQFTDEKNNKINEKRRKTNLKRYGFEYTGQVPEFKEKMKQTILNRYGVENSSQSKECREKVKNTTLERYGVEYPLQNNVIMEKAFKTRIKNMNYTKSKQEDMIANFLKDKFVDIKRQYFSELYPYHCDFYIPSLNLYIEYQGHQSHGNEPFNPTNKNHIEIVNNWKKKSKELNFKNEKKSQYLSYINTWTQKDPEKREVARKNKLNYLEFYDINQFMVWYKGL